MKQGISLPQIPKKLLDTNKELYDYLFGLQQALLAKQTDDYSAVDKASSDIASFITDNKASQAEAIAGTLDTKIITPHTLREGFNASGDAPVYACRAWVNFCGVPLTGTYSQTSNVVTVIITNHGLSTGMKVNVTPTSGSGVAGTYVVSVLNANTYTYTAGQQQSTSGNITQNMYIRASGNVSSITDDGVGIYTVNFTTAMEDNNYVIVIGGSTGDNGSTVCFASIVGYAGSGLTTLPTTDNVTVCSTGSGGNPTKIDLDYISVAIFR
jgi:hypothetical protein